MSGLWVFDLSTYNFILNTILLALLESKDVFHLSSLARMYCGELMEMEAALN